MPQNTVDAADTELGRKTVAAHINEHIQLVPEFAQCQNLAVLLRTPENLSDVCIAVCHLRSAKLRREVLPRLIIDHKVKTIVFEILKAALFVIVQRQIVKLRVRITVAHFIHHSEQHRLRALVSELCTSNQYIHWCLLAPQSLKYKSLV